MIWTDWGKKKIEKAKLDGSDRTDLVADRVGYPNGVTIDMKTGRIYWCDAELDKIESINMNGTDRRTIITSPHIVHPFGISTFGGYLYWTDWGRRMILRSRLDGHEIISLRNHSLSLMGLQVYDQERQQGTVLSMGRICYSEYYSFLAK